MTRNKLIDNVRNSLKTLPNEVRLMLIALVLSVFAAQVYVIQVKAAPDVSYFVAAGERAEFIDLQVIPETQITPEPKPVVVKAVASAPVYFDGAGGAFAALRACEAGGDYAKNTGNGFYGAYQFTPSTWRSNAPDGWKDVLPNEAPPEIQDQAAQNLQSRRGWSPWPACSRKLGLL